MSIRLKIFLSFFGVLLLFASNIYIYDRGNTDKAEKFAAVNRALDRQSAVIALERLLENRSADFEEDKILVDVELLGDMVEPPAVRVGKIAELTAAVDAFELQAREDDTAAVKIFTRLYRERILEDWLDFYRALEPGEAEEGAPSAGTEASNTGDGDPDAESSDAESEDPRAEKDPVEETKTFTTRALQQLGKLRDIESQRIGEATTEFNEVTANTDEKTLVVFLFSALVALILGIFLWTSIYRPLQDLKTGVRRIGQDDLDHRIVTRGRDELGELGEAFNAMSRNLKTARARVEEARAAAEEANQAKSTFLANMSHELRTPMNAIIGYSEMLTEDAEELGQAELLPDLQKIQAAGKHLMALINDVLDISKIEAGKMTLFVEELDVRTLVEETAATIQPLVEKNANRLVVEVGEDTGTFRADEMKVRQTLFNLLSNACKFTREGTVTLSASRRPGSAGERMVFEVRDTGIGMSEEQMRKVFDQFTQADSSTTRRFGGTGLGLTISRKFCQMMGGDITVESEAGHGTSFAVDLPVVVESPSSETPSRSVLPFEERPDESSAAEPEVETGTVLVIDDETASLDLTRRFLSREGFAVVAADTGVRGLELAQDLEPDAIVLDVMMPGMDGWSVLTELKKNPTTHHIPVVMLSMLDEKEKGFALGASEYLMKPLDRQRLTTYLSRYLASSRAGSGTVLVIEDDAETRLLLRRGLERDGWLVDEAENGRIALLRIERALPDLVLLDLEMPEMDGFDFVERLRASNRGRELPVVVLTGQDLDKAAAARLDGKVDAVLRKGVQTRESLLGEVRELVKVNCGKESPAASNDARDAR